MNIALDCLAALAPSEADDVRTWPVWTPLAPHAAFVVGHADTFGLVAGVASMMNKLGRFLLSRSKFREAEPFMQRALEIDERAFGHDHPDVARDLSNLAQLLQTTNQMRRGRALHATRTRNRRRSFGPDHPNVARHLNNLAQLLQDTNRLGEAEPLMRRRAGDSSPLPRNDRLRTPALAGHG